MYLKYITCAIVMVLLLLFVVVVVVKTQVIRTFSPTQSSLRLHSEYDIMLNLRIETSHPRCMLEQVLVLINAYLTRHYVCQH